MVFRKSSEKISHLENLLWVETYGRLVEDYYLRVVYKSLSYSDSLSVALGEILYKTLFYVSESYHRNNLVKMRLSVKSTALKLVHEI